MTTIIDGKLIVVKGKATQKEVALDRFPFTIGRNRKACLPISHTLVSRDHCEIVIRKGQLVVRDTGSSNGTRVNGEPRTAGAFAYLSQWLQDHNVRALELRPPIDEIQLKKLAYAVLSSYRCGPRRKSSRSFSARAPARRAAARRRSR